MMSDRKLTQVLWDMFRRLIIAFLVAYLSFLSAAAQENPLFFGEWSALAGKALQQEGVAVCEHEVTQEIIELGIDIQNTVREKALDRLLMMVAPDTHNAPRFADVQHLKFNELFSQTWQLEVLSGQPDCPERDRHGYLLGNIAYYNDGIKFIYGIDYFRPDFEGGAWKYNRRTLSPSCFATSGASSDNYETLYHTYISGSGASYPYFYEHPGHFAARFIPFGDLGWSTIFIQLKNCAQPSSMIISEDGMATYTERPDYQYRIVESLPASICTDYAPHIPGECTSVKMIEVYELYSGTIRRIEYYGIYGLFDLGERGEYIVPLRNYLSIRAALDEADLILGQSTAGDKQ